MKAVFTRDAVICTLLMLTIFGVIMMIGHFTGNTDALKTCTATRSIDVCEASLNP